MKRIPLAVAAVAALLAAAVVSAPALAKPATVKKKPATKVVAVKTNVTCNIKLVTQIPSDDTTVEQGADSGAQYGRAGCGKPLFAGVQQSAFSQDESGDLSGKYQQWFNAGSIFGQYTLTAEDTGPPTTTSFTNASYTGTVTVTNGTGLYRKATGTGTLSCTTTDLAHYTCTEKLKLVQLVKTTVTPKKTKKK